MAKYAESLSSERVQFSFSSSKASAATLVLLQITVAAIILKANIDLESSSEKSEVVKEGANNT